MSFDLVTNQWRHNLGTSQKCSLALQHTSVNRAADLALDWSHWTESTPEGAQTEHYLFYHFSTAWTGYQFSFFMRFNQENMLPLFQVSKMDPASLIEDVNSCEHSLTTSCMNVSSCWATSMERLFDQIYPHNTGAFPEQSAPLFLELVQTIFESIMKQKHLISGWMAANI